MASPPTHAPTHGLLMPITKERMDYLCQAAIACRDYAQTAEQLIAGLLLCPGEALLDEIARAQAVLAGQRPQQHHFDVVAMEKGHFDQNMRKLTRAKLRMHGQRLLEKGREVEGWSGGEAKATPALRHPRETHHFPTSQVSGKHTKELSVETLPTPTQVVDRVYIPKELIKAAKADKPYGKNRTITVVPDDTVYEDNGMDLDPFPPEG